MHISSAPPCAGHVFSLFALALSRIMLMCREFAKSNRLALLGNLHLEKPLSGALGRCICGLGKSNYETFQGLGNGRSGRGVSGERGAISRESRIAPPTKNVPSSEKTQINA